METEIGNGKRKWEYCINVLYGQVRISKSGDIADGIPKGPGLLGTEYTGTPLILITTNNNYYCVLIAYSLMPPTLWRF